MITRSLRDTIQIDFPGVLIYSPFFCNHIAVFGALMHPINRISMNMENTCGFIKVRQCCKCCKYRRKKKSWNISQLLQTMVNHIIITGVKQQMIVTTELTALQKLRVWTKDARWIILQWFWKQSIVPQWLWFAMQLYCAKLVKRSIEKSLSSKPILSGEVYPPPSNVRSNQRKSGAKLVTELSGNTSVQSFSHSLLHHHCHYPLLIMS